jgi:uncharacterized SAM-binding protein YcdF (DUF218 family)
MSASVIVNNAIGTILLPPLNLILLCACGILLSRRWPRFGTTLGLLALLALAAARLQRETGLPLLTSGGRPDGGGEPEADSMARSLREDFGVPVAWRERRSNNTAQNAAFAATILRREGIKRILLVTDAMHMPRAQAIFAATGLQVVAAPTMFFSRDRLDFLQFLPDGEGLRRSQYALHEWLGLAWYALRYRHGP